MTPIETTEPVLRALDRLERRLTDAQADLAWLSGVFAGDNLGWHLANVHAAIGALFAAILEDADDDDDDGDDDDEAGRQDAGGRR